MPEELAETISSVRERVRPTAAERSTLEETVERVIERTEAALAELPVAADVIRVGSTARDTWLRGDRDIDIFVRFPPSLEREALEEYGIEVGRTVLPNGRLEYAEHPYVTAEFAGYSVDLVPCFAVESGAEIQSAVDRTPFHAEYVREALTEELANDVRVLKRFCEAIGIYGSDLKTQGFSGYLTELLVLEYGGVAAVLEAAAEWHPPVHIDPEDHASATFDDPLVVIDPTDPGRNVAAVVTAESLAKFQHHARVVLADPDPEQFTVESPARIDEDEFLEVLEDRKTTAVAIRFSAPDLVSDQLFPQLRRSRRGLERALVELGFPTLRTTAFADGDEAVLFLELEVDRRPAVERHVGPPVHVREHAEDFLAKWQDRPVYGPFIDEDRYVVERPRSSPDAIEFLRSDRLLKVGLGVDIRRQLANGYEVLVGADVTELLPEFGTEIARFYDPSP